MWFGLCLFTANEVVIGRSALGFACFFTAGFCFNFLAYIAVMLQPEVGWALTLKFRENPIKVTHT